MQRSKPKRRAKDVEVVGTTANLVGSYKDALRIDPNDHGLEFVRRWRRRIVWTVRVLVIAVVICAVASLIRWSIV